MRQLLADLPAGAWALDLGSRSGSFPESMTLARVVRLDLEPVAGSGLRIVSGDARRLPFADAVFDAVVANHSLEHFEGLDIALGEVGRVLKPDGAIFISVPDASTFSDRLYRWLARGGGHVNAFTAPMQLAAYVTRTTGMPLRSVTVLYSGLSFLNRKNGQRVPLRSILVGGGFEWTLQVGTYILRLLDLTFHSRLSVYGWAYYFGNVSDPEIPVLSNVCVRCGAGNNACWLEAESRIHRFLLWRYFYCPGCGTLNLFLPDAARTMDL